MRRPEAEAGRWLAQARDDLDFTRWLLAEGEGRFHDKGCFVAQQSAEKAVKACLYALGARSVLGHSVVELIGKAGADVPGLALLGNEARMLDRFYIPTRYPNGLPGGAPFEQFGREDLASAVEMAGRILDAASAFLGRRAEPPAPR